MTGGTAAHRPPRVLLVTKGLGLGGSERLLADQARSGGADVGYTVAHVLADRDYFVAPLRAAGVDVVELAPRGARTPWPVALARLLRRTRPDVVHAHSPLPGAVARVLVRLGFAGRGAVTVTTEHNRWQSHHRATRLANALTLPLDRHVWAVSDEARSSVWPARTRRRVTTLHHGIDLDATRKAAASPTELPDGGGDPDAFTFVHVANRRPTKAHDVLLAAFALAAAEEPSLRLWLVGKEVDAPEFIEVLDRHPARDRIAALGRRSDVPALMAAARAGVLSSDHEGLPVAVMELLALGRPLVSTRVGGIPEAVRDGHEALLVPARDPEALAEAMVRLRRDRGLYDRLAEGAAARAAGFDARHARQVQVEAYREAAERRGSRGRRRRTV